MSYNQKKFLDYNGLVHLLEKFDDYPTNDILSTVIDSIDSAISTKVSDVQLNETSVVNNNIANIPIASTSNLGVVKVNSARGIGTFSDGTLAMSYASSDEIKGASTNFKPITPGKEQEAVFYGLAYAAGDFTQQSSNNSIGTYTNEAKAAIRSMLGAAASGDIPTVPVQDIQIDNASIVSNNIASIPIASSNYGVVKINPDYGIGIFNGILLLNQASADNIKSGNNSTKAVSAMRQHEAVFYGLSKVAGVDLKDETVTLGTYPAASKTAILTMLGAAASNDIPTVPVQDVQINGTSIVNNGIANINTTSSVLNGSTALITSGGVSGALTVAFGTTEAQIKGGTQTLRAIMPSNQHQAVFYGLAKAAGDSTQSQSNNTVGTYTTEAKTAIQTMLGVPSTSDVSSSIASAIGNIHQFELSIQQSLPTQDIDTHTIYLIPKTGATNDVYDEYVYINNGWEMIGNTQIDLSNYVQKDQIATSSIAGLVKINGSGLTIANDIIRIVPASDIQIKSVSNTSCPIIPAKQHQSVFYGLATAAGDTTQSASNNEVGVYTNDAKVAIRSMLGAGTPLDVQINGSSIITNEIANIPIASADNLGVVKISVAGGITIESNTHYLRTARATASQIKAGTDTYRPIVPEYQDKSVFYGLAKAAGDTTQAQSDNAIGTYTNNAKSAIQQMLDVPSTIDLAAKLDAAEAGLKVVRLI